MLTADKGARVGNMVIDTLIWCLLAIFVAFMLEMLQPSISSEISLILFTVYPFGLHFTYYFLFEYLLGKTPGKYLTKTTVVDRYGNKPTVGKIIFRSILRLLQHDWFSYLFGFTGLHDTFSMTIVVNDKTLV